MLGNPQLILKTHTGLVDIVDVHPSSYSLFGTMDFNGCRLLPLWDVVHGMGTTK
jgi:hypothetical protein